MALKTEAIILYARPLREADRLYYILTPLEGKLKLLSRSAGRSSSKLSGHLLPFSRVRLMIGRGRQDHLAGADIVTSFEALRTDLFTLTLASAVAELVLAVNVPGQEAGREYNLVGRAFELLAQPSMSGPDKAAVVRIFLWKLLSISGWQPDFNSCQFCGTLISAAERQYAPHKGFVCGNHNLQTIKVSSDVTNFLQQVIYDDDWESLLGLGEQRGFREVWAQLSQYFYQEVLDRPLQSLRLFDYLIGDVYYQKN